MARLKGVAPPGTRAAQGTRGQKGAGAGRLRQQLFRNRSYRGSSRKAECWDQVFLENALVQAAGGQKDQEIEALARQLEQEGIPVERIAKPVLDSPSRRLTSGVIVRTQPFRLMLTSLEYSARRF